MLTHYLLQGTFKINAVIRSLAVKVGSLLKLQGRTIPNSLHLLVVAEQLQMLNF